MHWEVVTSNILQYLQELKATDETMATQSVRITISCHADGVSGIFNQPVRQYVDSLEGQQ